MTTTTAFERMCERYEKTGKAKVEKYVEIYRHKDNDTLLKEYNSISYRIQRVSLSAYDRMLPVKNAMYRVLVERGLER